MLEYCNSACVVFIGKALCVVSNGGIMVKDSTILVKSLCSVKEGGGVDTNGTVCVHDIFVHDV
jgi:hypothetical protein